MLVSKQVTNDSLVHGFPRFLKPEDYVYFGLGSVDVLIFLITCIQLIRIIRNERMQKLVENIHTEQTSPSRTLSTNTRHSNINTAIGPTKWSGKKSFHGIIMACMFIRGCFFLALPYALHHNFEWPMAWLVFFIQFATCFFILAYLMLLLFWADFYYKIDGSPVGVFVKLRYQLLAFSISFGILFLSFCILLICVRNSVEAVSNVDILSSVVVSVIFLGIAVAFLYYGVRLSRLLDKFRLFSSRKQSQTRKVVGVAISCTVCFTGRACFVLYSAGIALNHPEEDFNAPWSVSLFFFLVFETIPICLMLFLLRKLPGLKPDPAGKPLLRSSLSG